jgi:uncharacterized membrane protein (UPF0127 family)
VVLENFTYTTQGKKKTIKVKPVTTFSTGLMFRSSSPPLLFELNKERKFSIHSLFCKPFTAIWLNEKKQAIKIKNIKNWKLKISGKGKYLLEIPTRIT